MIPGCVYKFEKFIQKTYIHVVDIIFAFNVLQTMDMQMVFVLLYVFLCRKPEIEALQASVQSTSHHADFHKISTNNNNNIQSHY